LSNVRPLAACGPRRLGAFTVVGRLGEGGMGIVYDALDPQGRRAAIKMARPEYAHDADFHACFAREVELLSRLHGYRTPRVLDADTASDDPWVATEYIPDPTLAQRIRSDGPLGPRQLLDAAVGIADALVAVHGPVWSTATSNRRT
jgi:serine/threonine protein kinase